MSHAVVHLVRHGEVENPHRVLYGRLPGYELSERGHAMARLVAKHFAEQKEHGTKFVSLISSPLIRAQQTADPIAQALELPITTEPGVIEAESKLEGYSNIKDTLLSTPRLWPLVRNPSPHRGESPTPTRQPAWHRPSADTATKP
ncbi:histidine phosphatase family protein [Pseudoglutamicibacter cumminsii]|uniref:histidine phosphatase family protein n=1 Tax=Pseudoglutamicibacter cumminsii TaxID=156979 RepID=UPI00267E896A|nr:histidine phosphatase family protein [Pseudoglutamicibacter cumminsii]